MKFYLVIVIIVIIITVGVKYEDISNDIFRKVYN